MRIISKFHDYYDSIRSFGFDPNIVYVRKTASLDLELDEQKILDPKPFSFDRNKIDLDNISVCFCGEIYRGFKLTVRVPDNMYPIDHGYIWSFDKLIKTFPQITDYFSKFNYRWAINESSLKEFFKVKPGSIDLHLKYKTPVISLRKKVSEIVIEKDICLRSLNFQQVMDPYTTFQKLAVFVGNILIDQGKTPWPIPDKLKAQSKGFDNYSFRKRPQDGPLSNS